MRRTFRRVWFGPLPLAVPLRLAVLTAFALVWWWPLLRSSVGLPWGGLVIGAAFGAFSAIGARRGLRERTGWTAARLAEVRSAARRGELPADPDDHRRLAGELDIALGQGRGLEWVFLAGGVAFAALALLVEDFGDDRYLSAAWLAVFGAGLFLLEQRSRARDRRLLERLDAAGVEPGPRG